MVRAFAGHFGTHELVRWPKIEEVYGVELKNSPVFVQNPDLALKLWEELHKRVVEHVTSFMFIGFIRFGRILELWLSIIVEYQ